MTSIVVLKFFHYISLFLAGGLGVGNALLFKNHQKAKMPPSAPVQKTMMTMARLGLCAIIILWLTGIPLTYHVYGTFALGWAFHLKLFGATSLLAAIAFLNFHLSICAKVGKPANQKVMTLLPFVLRSSLAVVLLGIAILTSAS